MLSTVVMGFQSLGRDSGGWDHQYKLICVVVRVCFNPSVGIQVVGTLLPVVGRGNIMAFQSLGRDSGGWDSGSASPRIMAREVSIPRSGFRWLGL